MQNIFYEVENEFLKNIWSILHFKVRRTHVIDITGLYFREISV
jgi:hypothetical protein